MGTARIEIVRLANKHTLYPGQVDRRTPNPLEIIAVASSESAAAQSDPVTDVALYQDLYARIRVSEAGRVGIGEGSTDDGEGYQLDANEVVVLPVRAGDVIEVIDLA